MLGPSRSELSVLAGNSHGTPMRVWRPPEMGQSTRLKADYKRLLDQERGKLLDARQGRRKLISIVFRTLYHKVPCFNALIKEAQLLLPSLLQT